MTVLASGSGGNSILVEAERTRVLVDAGLAARELARRMERSTTPSRLDDVQALLVTHEHTDHASAAATLGSAGISLYCTAGTARAGRLKGTHCLVPGETRRIGALEVLPVLLPHDAAEPVGLIFADEHSRAGILTDCGHPDPQVAAAFSGCDLLVLEANHDPDLLRAGAYPPSLKRRVGGRRGHLSNEQAAELLRVMGRPLPSVIVLAHLSQKNNRPRLARTVIERQIRHQAGAGPRPRLVVAAQARPTAPVVLGRGRVELLPAQDERQLSLAFPD